MNAKCPCQHCNGNIGFDALDAGRETACPHCGMETVLFVPPPRVVALPTTPVIQMAQAETTPRSYDELLTHRQLPQKDKYAGASSVLLVCSFVIPFIGFFGGIWLMAKGEHGRGVACLAISIVFGMIWLAVLTSVS
jgi:hypothetical protein